MMNQLEVELEARGRGFHLITEEIQHAISPHLPDRGLVHLLITHTSAGLTINENADPSVRLDFERYFSEIVKEDLSGLLHTAEGIDDMPAHVKSSIVGHQLTIPVRHNQLVLGTWQGIYLCEFRNQKRQRKIFITILGDHFAHSPKT